jgi:anti-sigma factor RsiW
MTSRNTTPHHADRPRLFCRFVRQWAIVFSDRRPAHARSCPDCEAYFQALDNLETRLRGAASAPDRDAFEPSPDYERTLLRAVRATAPGTERPRTWFSSGVWAVGGIGAVAALVAIVLSLNPGPTVEPQAQLAEQATAEEAAVIITAVESLSMHFVDSVIPAAGGLVAENPLQQELGLVYSDVRSALDFLALNFLPTTERNSPPTPTRRI